MIIWQSFSQMAQTVRTMDTHMVSEESNKVLAHKDTFKRLISTCYLVLKYLVWTRILWDNSCLHDNSGAGECNVTGRGGCDPVIWQLMWQLAPGYLLHIQILCANIKPT